MFLSPLPVGLIATNPRLDMLVTRSLPSISCQVFPLRALVIVSDRRALSPLERERLRRVAPSLDIHILENTGIRGAAGSWNTGLKYIKRHWPNSYVAILDDDDTWDPGHIRICHELARREAWPDVVVSGLRIVKDGKLIPRDPPSGFEVVDFLVGNPGWQGSNTFARLDVLFKVGLFTEGLVSSNDRDLAIRILSLPESRIAYTGQHTATWYIDSQRECLSSPGSESKKTGLAQFWVMYGHNMTSEQRTAFFRRAKKLFGVSETEILQT